MPIDGKGATAIQLLGGFGLLDKTSDADVATAEGVAGLLSKISYLVTELSKLEKMQDEIDSKARTLQMELEKLGKTRVDIDSQHAARRKEIVTLGQKLKLKMAKDKPWSDSFNIINDNAFKVYQALPAWKVHTNSDFHVLASLIGPLQDEAEKSAELNSQLVATARTISTYPYLYLGDNLKRQGDPICDQFRVHLLDGGVTVVAVADGCNWGSRPFKAAQAASTAASEYLIRTIHLADDIQDVGSLLLKSMWKAQKGIVVPHINEPWECGTTTLITGVLVPVIVKDPPQIEDSTLTTVTPPAANAAPYRPAWCFVCCSLGDCKAFCFNGEEVIDVTAGNRFDTTDPTDPCGRLGPYVNDKDPDLRNLKVFHHICREGDLIMVCSDGVHDNLDAQELGQLPKDLLSHMPNSANMTWDQAQTTFPTEVMAVKTKYMCQLLKSLITNNGESKKPTPRQAVTNVLRHCLKITKPSREFMEQNPELKLPSDYTKYPGKLDHTTMACFRVGALPQ